MKVKLLIGSALLSVASLASADGPNFSALSSGVDFGTATTAIIAIAGAIAGALVARKGASLVLGMLSK